MEGVTERLKPKFERLLNDASYVTIEAALFSLWNSFPGDRARYLDQTESVVGFQDKNVRQLWLALAIITPDYRMENKSEFVQELREYTGASYSFEIRQKAFEYLAELQLYNDAVIDNLVNASVHHNWRFRNGARNMLEQLSEDTEVKMSLKDRLEQYSENEKQYLISKILIE
jgi:aminopeptidase N